MSQKGKASYTFGQMSFDEEFRRNVLKLLTMAKKQILIITGEGSSYRYQDLRWGLERAIKRGVSCKIYCVHPPAEYVNKVIQLGCDVYIGEKDLDEHYFIVDDQHCMISAVRPKGEVGKRAGEVRVNDKKFAIEKVRLFNKLVSKLSKEKIKLEEDPLWRLVNNPMDFGFDTHSEKFEEGL